jgi:hypothetical protein
MAGQIGIWRQAAGGTNFNSASWTDYNFDTEEEAEGSFSAAAGVDDDKEMAEGHVLALYNLAFESGGGSLRSHTEAGLNLDGADLIYGRSGGYIRRFAHSKSHQAGGAILNVASAGDLLKARVRRTDSNLTAACDVAANMSGLQVISLPASWSYFRATRSTPKNTAGIQTGNPLRISVLLGSAFWDVVDWDAPDEAGAGFSLLGGAGSDEIQVPSGKVLVSYGVRGANSGIYRTNVVARIQKRDGAGGAWSPVTNSYAAGFCRKADGVDDAYANIAGVIIDLSALADPRIRVEFIEERETGARSCSYSEAYITIAAVPDTVDVIRLYNEAAETTFLQAFASTALEVTATEIDASFGHPDTYTARMINAGKYLFLVQCSTDRTVVDTDRKEIEIRPALGGVAHTWGRFSHFNRGDQAQYSTWIGGAGGGLVVKTSSGNVDLTLLHGCHANNDNAGIRTAVGYLALQGVALSTLAGATAKITGLDADATLEEITGKVSGLDVGLTYTESTDPLKGTVHVNEERVVLRDRGLQGPVKLRK